MENSVTSTVRDPMTSLKYAPISVRNDILKLLYAGMLLEMPQSLVREFWQRHPLPQSSEVKDEHLLYSMLWQDKRKVPLEYLVSVLNDVEPFFVLNKFNIIDFIRKTFHRINKGMLMSAKSILWLGKPFLSYFYLEKDLRPLILSIVDYFTEQLASGIVQKLIRHTSDGTWSTATILVMHSQPLEHFKLQKKIFVKEFLHYDCELWTGMLLQATPRCLNMPCFEELHMVCDCRDIREIIPAAMVSIDQDTVYINNEVSGTITSFESFCEHREFSLEKYRIPSPPVIHITRDYFCPDRQRTVLHAGCAYGAPVYMYSFRYRKGLEKPEDFMATIIDDATTDSNEAWAHVHELHEALLESVSFKAAITYYAAEESISVNGKHLTKSTPAKILRKMISAYHTNGQTEFEHKEFIRDNTIIYDPVNPNLNIRIQRLSKLLQEQCSGISISRSEKGIIKLNVYCKISYDEK